MKLKVINSNSACNAYILESESEALLIECGVRFSRIKEALDFNLSKVVGCLVSHEHNDHCAAVGDVAAAGINVYASKGTIDCFKIKSHRFHSVQAHKSVSIGSFLVYPFDVKHDAKEPMCFIIWHRECGKVLFLTDSYYVAYTFDGLNNVIIEANYCQQILDRRLSDGESPKFLRNRVLQSHMSITTCKDFLSAND